MNEQKKSRLMLAFSSFIFGTLAPFVRAIPVSSGELSLLRAVLASILISAYLVLTKQPIPFRSIRRSMPLLVFSGMAMGFNWVLLFEAYRYTTVSIATLSYYFAPVIVTAVSPLLFHEKITRKQILCFVMSTAGLVLLTGLGDTSQGSDHFRGILLGLGAAVLYATVILLNKYIQDVEGIQRTVIQFAAAILVLIPYVLMNGGFHFMQMNATGWVNLLLVGLIHTGITYCIYFSSLKNLPGQQISILSYIDPLVAVLISVFFLKEAISPMQIIGGLLILGFTLWNELG